MDIFQQIHEQTKKFPKLSQKIFPRKKAQKMLFRYEACLQDCGQEEFSRCAKPLQLLQSTSDLSFAPKREELDELCPEFHNGLRCIGSYTRRCMTQVQRDQFNKIYQGTNELIKDLCREGDYQNEFLKHSNCLQTVKPLHVKCAERYQQTMSSIFQASANQNAYNQQQQHTEGGENDVENVKIVCW